jgi:DNA-directed RNA polymerase subunit M/transcription elongation factor TFIIS
MDFCSNCDNYLIIKEINLEGKRCLYYYCMSCSFKKECKKHKIKTNNYTSHSIDKSYLNTFKANDKTLPRKISKCQKCKKKNNNVYEIKYFNNCYNI